MSLSDLEIHQVVEKIFEQVDRNHDEVLEQK